ncbi:MAG: SLC13 family permease [Alphaproteobacteria bacterium]|nr:SLC13 family permease [Alphaproteobacteria bacterium]
MTIEQALAFGVMAGAVGLFIWGKLRYDLVALLALVTGVVLGVIPADRMFSGFSNDLIWIIASVLVLSAAIARSGLVEQALLPVLERLDKPQVQIPAFAGAVMILSMITKNIGALAIMMPIAIRNGQKTGTPVSQLLMPMSFASLLGGLVTLVGTSPNVIVSSVRQSLLGEPYQLFDFAPVGLGVCAAGFAFLAIAPFFIKVERSSPTSVAESLESAKYVTELSFPEGSDWIGKPFSDLDALSSEATDVLSIVTESKNTRPTPDRLIAAGDHVIVEGKQADLEKFAASAKLSLTGERHRETKESSDGVRVVEGVIARDSSLIGRSVSQGRLHERYGLSLLAVSREGSRIDSELRSLRLRGGDVVIFKAGEGELGDAFAELHVLPLSERIISLGVKRFGFAPLLLLAAAVLAIGMGWAPIHLAFAAAAVGVLLLRVMSMTDAYRSVDGSLLVLLACLIPISESIDRTGGAALIAAPLAQLLGPLPPFLAVAALIVVGMAVTPFLNNAATVLIVAPIAVAVARDLGVDPDAYLMAVAIGAACDFLTPIGHQCNTLVMGPGGYRFGDYWRLGLPLTIIVLLVATPLILIFWPLAPV